MYPLILGAFIITFLSGCSGSRIDGSSENMNLLDQFTIKGLGGGGQNNTNSQNPSNPMINQLSVTELYVDIRSLNKGDNDAYDSPIRVQSHIKDGSVTANPSNPLSIQANLNSIDGYVCASTAFGCMVTGHAHQGVLKIESTLSKSALIAKIGQISGDYYWGVRISRTTPDHHHLAYGHAIWDPYTPMINLNEWAVLDCDHDPMPWMVTSDMRCKNPNSVSVIEIEIQRGSDITKGYMTTGYDHIDYRDFSCASGSVECDLLYQGAPFGNGYPLKSRRGLQMLPGLNLYTVTFVKGGWCAGPYLPCGHGLPPTPVTPIADWLPMNVEIQAH